MQRITLEELKHILFYAFRDHLTMKDIENIIINEEESLKENSGNCQTEFEGGECTRTHTHTHTHRDTADLPDLMIRGTCGDERQPGHLLGSGVDEICITPLCKTGHPRFMDTGAAEGSQGRPPSRRGNRERDPLLRMSPIPSHLRAFLFFRALRLVRTQSQRISLLLWIFAERNLANFFGCNGAAARRPKMRVRAQRPV